MCSAFIAAVLCLTSVFDDEEQWMFAELEDHQSATCFLYGEPQANLAFCFEAEIHERSDLMGSPGLFTHTTDIHIALSPQMLCHIMAVLTSWCKASIGVFALYISF